MKKSNTKKVTFLIAFLVLYNLAIYGYRFYTSPHTTNLDDSLGPLEIDIQGLQHLVVKKVGTRSVSLAGQIWQTSGTPENQTLDVNGQNYLVRPVSRKKIQLIPNESQSSQVTHPYGPDESEKFKTEGVKVNPAFTSKKSLLSQLGIRLIHFEGGTFKMGSPPSERFRDFDETQRIAVLRPFDTMTTLITRKQWRELTGDLVYFPRVATQDERTHWQECPDCAMTYLSWEEVNQVLTILNSRGIKVRFLTEAEAEYLLRILPDGKTISKESYPWGNDPTPNKLNQFWFTENSKGLGHPVFSKPPYAGLYDIRGNAFTLTSDHYGEDFARVIKGGGWGSGPNQLRSAFRAPWGIRDRNHMIGVRLVFE